MNLLKKKGKFNMNPTFTDRIVSALSYFTFGIFSIVWLIFAKIINKKISHYLLFNIFQSIMISVILAVISLLYSIAINFMSVIPFVNNLVKTFDLFFNQTPIYFSFTISGLITTILVLYLILMSILGLKPYVPLVSDTVNNNFGG